MKKVLAICLMMVFVVCMGTSVSAANGFVSSPSESTGPVLVSFEALDDDCSVTLSLTPYGDKSKLSADALAKIEAAYASVTGASDLAKLNADLAKLAGDKDLAVANLFDISASGCTDHTAHGAFRIVLDVEALNRFVGLLHMKDGAWELVDAKIINSGKQLEFTVDSLSPFAIVVDAGENGGNSPSTGDNVMNYVYAVIMAGCALTIAVITAKSKKNA